MPSLLDADASSVEPASIGRAPVGPVSVGPAPAGPASVESGSAEPALAEPALADPALADPALVEPASDGPASVLAVSAAAVVTGSRPEVRGLGGALVVDVPAGRSAGRSGGSPSPPTSCRIPAPDPKPASVIEADDRASEHVPRRPARFGVGPVSSGWVAGATGAESPDGICRCWSGRFVFRGAELSGAGPG